MGQTDDVLLGELAQLRVAFMGQLTGLPELWLRAFAGSETPNHRLELRELPGQRREPVVVAHDLGIGQQGAHFLEAIEGPPA